MQTNKISLAKEAWMKKYYQHGVSVEGDLLGLLVLLLLGDLGLDLGDWAARAHRVGGQGHVTERRRVLGNKSNDQ